MKITTRLVLQQFLNGLLEQLQHQKTIVIDAFFEDFFTKDEIIAILKSNIGNNTDEYLNVLHLDKKVLLEKISNADVLRYYLKDWNIEIEQNSAITAIEVYKTLEQLGLYTHYLMSKAIINWDEYDFSNYRSLSRKAGKVTTVYGLYDIDVEKEDVERVESPPKRFYETHENATIAMDELISQGTFKKEDVHVLPRLVGCT